MLFSNGIRTHCHTTLIGSLQPSGITASFKNKDQTRQLKSSTSSTHTKPVKSWLHFEN